MHPLSAWRESIALTERLRVVSRILKAVEWYFPHAPAEKEWIRGERWHEEMRAVEKASDRLSFSLHCKKLLASFRNSHTEFEDLVLRRTRLGFRARKLADGAWAIIQSSRENVPVGSVIASFDGHPISEFFEPKYAYISASRREAAEASIFFHPYLFPQRFELGFSDGFSVVLEQLENKQSVGNQEPAVTLRNDGVSVLRIPSFAIEHHSQVLSFLEEIKSSKALVIDIRGNGGGSTPTEVLRHLFSRPFQLWRVTSPFHPAEDLQEDPGETQSGIGRHRTFPAPTIEPATDAFSGRIVILHDVLTGSAAEDFLQPFAVSMRAVLVGETTAGSSGEAYFEDLGNGLSFRVAAKRMSFPDGTQFEGLGIKPDIEILPKVEELREGRDSALERAIELLAI